MTKPPADEVAPVVGEQASGIASGSVSASAVPAPAIDFTDVVPRLESSLLRYVAQLLGRTDPDLEDIVQDAFLRLHKQVHEHGDASVQNVSTWLFRVAHNLTMDTLRKRKVRKQTHLKMTGQPPASTGSPAPAEHHPERVVPVAPDRASTTPFDAPKIQHDEDTLGDLERREACTCAMSELATLPDTQRQALTLKMIDGMTIREIAAVTETSIGNVGYRISQGLAELSRRLKKAGVI